MRLKKGKGKSCQQPALDRLSQNLVERTCPEHPFRDFRQPSIKKLVSRFTSTIVKEENKEKAMVLPDKLPGMGITKLLSTFAERTGRTTRILSELFTKMTFIREAKFICDLGQS